MCHRVLMSCSGRFTTQSDEHFVCCNPKVFKKNQTRNNNEEISCHFGSQKCVFGEFFVVKVSKTEVICDTEVLQANFILANSFSKTTTTKKSHKGKSLEKKKIVMEWRDRLLMEKMATEALLMHFLSTSRGSRLTSLYIARKMGARGHDLLKHAQRYLEMQFMS